MRLSEYASTRKTRGSYKMPRSVQQSIPIDRIYADGVWQSENVFSLMWQISDINYAMQSDAAKQNILTQLGTVYAGIPADCWMQVCIVSQRMDEKAFARDVLYHRENDGFDALRAERNRQIKANARENGNVVQHKYIIVSTNKPGVKEARERFVQVQGHLLSAFSALECAVTPLDNRARLEVLHKFFRISEEGRFNFDFDNCAKLGQDFRDSIAPDCIRFCKKHIEIEDFYAKCMTISEYPQQLDDKFISALLQQVPYIVLSIDIEPVETEDPHAFYALLCNVAGLLCAVQVVVEFVRSMLLRQRQMQMMRISSQTAQEKYEQAQASVRQTAAFRHEWKNHIAALHLLAQRQDRTELRNYLDRLDGELEQLSPRNFTANPTVNTIFQRFAAQAKKKDVTFRVSAVLPEMLQIREDDLCSLLFNMLDNALEAAAQTEQGEILCSMQIRRQYLAIRCENTYSGTLRTDENGELLTTKDDASDHGFGLMKMRAIAKKYGSVLDISYDENRFTVMTALKLLPEKKNQ